MSRIADDPAEVTWKQRCRAWLRRRQQCAFLNQLARPAPASAPPAPLNVLVLGIYLADHFNLAEHLVAGYAATRRHRVEQIWAAIGTSEVAASVEAVTRLRLQEKVPKFVLLNRLLAQVDLSRYDYLIVSDDDITLPRNFLDAYLSWVRRYDLAIAQPARTRHSYKHHRFVLQQRFVKLRETRFVEIGPVFSFDRRACEALLPFDEASPMGWGYDYVWPTVAQASGWRMGIVDGVPVDHSYRPQANTYGVEENDRIMKAYLASRPHHARHLAMTSVCRHF